MLTQAIYLGNECTPSASSLQSTNIQLNIQLLCKPHSRGYQCYFTMLTNYSDSYQVTRKNEL